MERDAGALGPHHPPTPDEARAALADIERVRASTAARSATPWPLWFSAFLTVYVAAFPVMYGGVLVRDAWLLSREVWGTVLLAVTAAYWGLFALAARAWKQRTGVALRFDVLPKQATVPLAVGLPLLLVGSGWVYRATGQAWWLVIASVVGAAVSVGFHLAFVRLHRERGQAS